MAKCQMHWIPVLLESNKRNSMGYKEINLCNTKSYPIEKPAPSVPETKILINSNPECAPKYRLFHQKAQSQI